MFTWFFVFNVVTIERTNKHGVVHARVSPREGSNFDIVLSWLKLMLNDNHSYSSRERRFAIKALNGS